MSAVDGKPTARPSRERAMWLLSPVSSLGRNSIQSEQYEELRSEACALRNELRAMKGMHPIREPEVVDASWPPKDHEEVSAEVDRIVAAAKEPPPRFNHGREHGDPNARCTCSPVYLGGLDDPCPRHG